MDDRIRRGLFQDSDWNISSEAGSMREWVDEVIRDHEILERLPSSPLALEMRQVIIRRCQEVQGRLDRLLDGGAEEGERTQLLEEMVGDMLSACYLLRTVFGVSYCFSPNGDWGLEEQASGGTSPAEP